MKYTEDIVVKFLNFIEKERSLSSACLEMQMNPYQVLGLVNHIKSKGINIVMNKINDDIYMVNMGDYEFVEKNEYYFDTDESNEFKFIVIADPRLGSKSQQLSILNDIYLKGHQMGYNDVILCGNISISFCSRQTMYCCH